MSEVAGKAKPYFVGWDVGGWNCDRNPESRDALVILDAERKVVGTPWRGNLRTTINEAKTTRSWLEALFALCEAELPVRHIHVTLAIDTPLGFSHAFTRLLVQHEFTEPIGQSETNPYLFRETERFLFEHGLSPLSPIKDMIGSQATKGLHVLAKFASKVEQRGVWSDGDALTAIEAYPSACKGSVFAQELLSHYGVAENGTPRERQGVTAINHQDQLDALTCALIAYAFECQPDVLAQPSDNRTRDAEGWIWVPRDALKQELPAGRTQLA